MLRKIDCVMIRVDDLEAAKKYYIDVFGLRPGNYGIRMADRPSPV